MDTTFIEFNDQSVFVRTAKIPIRNGNTRGPQLQTQFSPENKKLI